MAECPPSGVSISDRYNIIQLRWRYSPSRIFIVKTSSLWCGIWLPVPFLLRIAAFIESLSTLTYWESSTRLGAKLDSRALLGLELYLVRSSTRHGSSTRSRALLGSKLYSARSFTRLEALLGSKLYSAWEFTQPGAPTRPRALLSLDSLL